MSLSRSRTWNCRLWKYNTSKWWTKLQDIKMQDALCGPDTRWRKCLHKTRATFLSQILKQIHASSCRETFTTNMADDTGESRPVKPRNVCHVHTCKCLARNTAAFYTVQETCIQEKTWSRKNVKSQTCKFLVQVKSTCISFYVRQGYR